MGRCKDFPAPRYDRGAVERSMYQVMSTGVNTAGNREILPPPVAMHGFGRIEQLLIDVTIADAETLYAVASGHPAMIRVAALTNGLWVILRDRLGRQSVQLQLIVNATVDIWTHLTHVYAQNRVAGAAGKLTAMAFYDLPQIPVDGPTVMMS